MSNTIAVYNFKGGVGKTSTSVNLALSWSRSFKVLVIDCDPQANLTSALTNSAKHNSNLFTISKKLLHNDQPEINPIAISHYLHVIPGDYRMAELESNSQFISFGHIIFYNLLKWIKPKYDFIILDCPTHFGITVKSFIANVNSILIPSIPDSFSMSGFRKLLGYLAEIETDNPLNILGIFFNQYRKNTKYHQSVVRQAEKELGELILDQKVRESIKVSEAHAESESIYRYTDKYTEEISDVAEDFLKLSDEIISKLNTLELTEILDEMEIKVSN